MPNYNITINSRFNPFTYQELLAPVAAETAAHRAAEESYAALDAEAAQWENILDPIKDKELYDQYRNYRQGIADMADKLNYEGYYQNAYKDTLAKKSQYMQDIAPIKNAYDRWQTDIKTQAEAKAKDPTRIFDIDANTLSTQDYYNNRGLNANTAQVSGELLRTQVLQTAKEYAKILTRRGHLQDLGIPYQYTKEFGHGATEGQVLNAILQDPKAKPILSTIVQNVLKGSGIEDWNSVQGDKNSYKYKQAYAIASTGLYGALGETTIKDYTDSLGIAKAKASAANPPEELPSIRTSDNNWVDPESSETYKNRVKAYKELAKFNEKYGDKTGRKNLQDIIFERTDNYKAGWSNLFKKDQAVDNNIWDNVIDAIKDSPELINSLPESDKETVQNMIKRGGYSWGDERTLSTIFNKAENAETFKKIGRAALASNATGLSKEALKYFDDYIRSTNSLPTFDSLTSWHEEGIADLNAKGVSVTTQLNPTNAAAMTRNILDPLETAKGEFKTGAFYQVGKFGRKTGDPLKQGDLNSLIGNKKLTNFTYYTGTDAFDSLRGDNKAREEGIILHFGKDDSSSKTHNSSSVFIPLESLDIDTQAFVMQAKDVYAQQINLIKKQPANTPQEKQQKRALIASYLKQYADYIVQQLAATQSVRLNAAGSGLSDPFKQGID